MTLLPGLESEKRDYAWSQWYTPPDLAQRIWDWVLLEERPRAVLEPAAGRGALVNPILELPFSVRRVVAVDIDDTNVKALRAVGVEAGRHDDEIFYSAFNCDFLAMEPVEWDRFDLVLMNPPYENGQAEAFILHALEFANVVVGVFKASILHGSKRYNRLWQQAVVIRGTHLMSRPKFGQGEKSDSAKTDFVVLEIERGCGANRRHKMEMWP